MSEMQQALESFCGNECGSAVPRGNVLEENRLTLQSSGTMLE